MSLVARPKLHTKWYLPGIIEGLGITIGYLFKNLFRRNQMMTLNYPEEKYVYSPRFRGNHVLTVRRDGAVRCTACMLCATACPANCINIEAGEQADPLVEKYPIKYEIDMLRCVFCGFCEEACPVDAIRMGPEWQTPDLGNGNFVYDIEQLAYRPALKGGIASHVDDEERRKAGI